MEGGYRVISARVVGVRLVGHRADGERVGPIDVVEVPLARGLTALAGVNGAGKTRVLQALEAALAGRTWDGGSWQLLIQLRDGPSEEPALEDLLYEVLDFDPDGVPWREQLRDHFEEA